MIYIYIHVAHSRLGAALSKTAPAASAARRSPVADRGCLPYICIYICIYAYIYIYIYIYIYKYIYIYTCCPFSFRCCSVGNGVRDFRCPPISGRRSRRSSRRRSRPYPGRLPKTPRRYGKSGFANPYVCIFIYIYIYIYVYICLYLYLCIVADRGGLPGAACASTLGGGQRRPGGTGT